MECLAGQCNRAPVMRFSTNSANNYLMRFSVEVTSFVYPLDPLLKFLAILCCLSKQSVDVSSLQSHKVSYLTRFFLFPSWN